MKKLLIASFLTFFTSQATAGVYKDFVPDNVSQIHIEISDGASEGCWTNIGEVKRYTEDKLELEGFNIRRDKFDGYEDRNHYIVTVLVNAKRNGGLCFGSINLDITKALRTNKIIGMFSLGQTGANFSGQENINRSVLSHVDQFIKEVRDPQWGM
ncbi:hypothetical protein N9J49_04985 [Amylibacter sp.]|nr:hypothetical protein [Amylibacter sp.]MDB4070950.1 hypothetical protein [Amylibacter sp.]|tara:strand:- start:262 stop:726 length:465 start_codon:yes stop_codon:yes gene_type:complete